MTVFNRLRSILEAGLVGLFFVQALRATVGFVYSRTASASIFPALDPAAVDPNLPGLVSPAVVQSELVVLGIACVLPLLAIGLGRWRSSLLLAGLAVAGARLVMALPSAGISPAIGAYLTVGTGLFWVATFVRHRQIHLPYAFVIGFTVDQLLRAAGNTLDPSLSTGYGSAQIVLSALLVVVTAANFIRPPSLSLEDSRGLFTLWGGFGLGGLLFLQLALLASPNASAARSAYDYTILVPALIAATALPLVPAVQRAARGVVSLFDASVQGWVWMLVLALFLVVGTRVQGAVGAGALVAAQFVASLTWWWLVRPQAEKERNASGLWMLVAVVVFGLFVVMDLFTFEYAYVRELSGQFAFLNRVVTPLLRGFRGLGLAVLIVAVVTASLPVIASRRRAAWRDGSVVSSLVSLLVVGVLIVLGAFLSRPPVVEPYEGGEFRIGTYNIHAGYNEFFHSDLESLARTIQQSGANVVLLQEVEAGRLTSFGVDQTLWLARKVGMDRRFYATNEGLQGLAVLSNVEIVFDDGVPLTSEGQQTGLQRVVLQPDDRPITLYNTWLGVLLEGVGDDVAEQEQDQVRQLNEILSIMLAHGEGSIVSLGRIVVGGTFNNVPSSDLILRMRQTSLTNPFADQPQATSHTFVQTSRRARLDYLFTNLLPLGAVVIDSSASDHRLAVVSLALR